MRSGRRGRARGGGTRRHELSKRAAPRYRGDGDGRRRRRSLRAREPPAVSCAFRSCESTCDPSSTRADACATLDPRRAAVERTNATARDLADHRHRRRRHRRRLPRGRSTSHHHRRRHHRDVPKCSSNRVRIGPHIPIDPPDQHWTLIDENSLLSEISRAGLFQTRHGDILETRRDILGIFLYVLRTLPQCGISIN